MNKREAETIVDLLEELVKAVLEDERTKQHEQFSNQTPVVKEQLVQELLRPL